MGATSDLPARYTRAVTHTCRQGKPTPPQAVDKDALRRKRKAERQRKRKGRR
jgi:hypothetical protein